MKTRTYVLIAIVATSLAFVDPFPRVIRGLFAVLGFAAALIAAGHFARWTTPVPPQHLPTVPSAPRAPLAMFDVLEVQPAAPEPPPGIDPYTGEVLNPVGQPQGSAGAEVPRPSPLPCPASNPLAAPIDPVAAPVGLGTFVRWAKGDRSGLGQVLSVGTEEAEIRPAWPCPTRQLTVPLHALTPLTPDQLAEALRASEVHA